MRLGEMTYNVTHFYLGTVEASGQLHAPDDLSPRKGPLVPTEKESRWEMNTSWTPQQNVLSPRTNSFIFIFILSGFLPWAVSSTWRQDLKYTVYGPREYQWTKSYKTQNTDTHLPGRSHLTPALVERKWKHAKGDVQTPH